MSNSTPSSGIAFVTFSFVNAECQCTNAIAKCTSVKMKRFTFYISLSMFTLSLSLLTVTKKEKLSEDLKKTAIHECPSLLQVCLSLEIYGLNERT